MCLTQTEILFNELFDKANKKMDGLIILGNYRSKKLNYFGKKRCFKAIDLYKQGLAIFPNHWQSLFFVGKLYQVLKQNNTALDYFEKALDIQRFNFSLLQEASLAAMHLGL